MRDGAGISRKLFQVDLFKIFSCDSASLRVQLKHWTRRRKKVAELTTLCMASSDQAEQTVHTVRKLPAVCTPLNTVNNTWRQPDLSGGFVSQSNQPAGRSAGWSDSLMEVAT